MSSGNSIYGSLYEGHDSAVTSAINSHNLSTESHPEILKRIAEIEAGDKTFLYEQNSPSDTWEITHGLDKFPSVTVVDTANTVVTGQVDYLNKNQVILRFNYPFSGFAHLN